MSINRMSAIVAIIAIAFPCLTSARADSDSTQPAAGMGIMVGEVTDSSALVQVRLTKTTELVDHDLPGANGSVQFQLFSLSVKKTKPIATVTLAADPKRDYIVRAAFKGLKPGKMYICRTSIGNDPFHFAPGPVAHFQTLRGAKQTGSASFVVVTGMNYAKFHGDERIDRKQHLLENNTELPRPYAGKDKPLGYPALASILKLRPSFLVGTGDNVYYDTPDNPRAESVKDMRQKWHEQFVQPRYRQLFSKVPTYWEIDDHDFRIDDGDNTGDYLPSTATAKRIMLEQLPYAAADTHDALTYRTHRITPDLQVWFTENRWYRSPNLSPDGPEKTIWGEKQKTWLMSTLLASDAKFKLLISPTPMIGPDDARKTDNHTNIGGFRHERDQFFAWLQQTGLDKKHFYILCGDRHWQYHSVHPTGIEEFSCGALVDANSRLGRKPGDAKSTDPKGLIKQPYSQDPRSGGFLHLQVAPKSSDSAAKLTFTWHDERGKVLHQHVKQ